MSTPSKCACALGVDAQERFRIRTITKREYLLAMKEAVIDWGEFVQHSCFKALDNQGKERKIAECKMTNQSLWRRMKA